MVIVSRINLDSALEPANGDNLSQGTRYFAIRRQFSVIRAPLILSAFGRRKPTGNYMPSERISDEVNTRRFRNEALLVGFFEARVRSLTYIPTNRSARWASRPRENERA